MGTALMSHEDGMSSSLQPDWESLLDELESISAQHETTNPFAFDFSDDWHSAAPTYAAMLSEREALLSRVDELMRTLEIATEALSQSNANCRRLQGILQGVSDGLSEVASSFWAKPVKSSLMHVVAQVQTA